MPAIISSAVPQLRSGAWRLLACQITHQRYWLGRSTVFCSVSYRRGSDARPRVVELVAKVYWRDHGPRAAREHSALSHLWGAGLRPPARYRVPQPFGVSSEPAALIQAKAPGVTWAELLRHDNEALRLGSTHAAGWLLRLQNSRVLSSADAPDAGAAAHRLADQLAQAFPRYRRQLEAVASRLFDRLGEPGDPPVPSHGDFDPSNVVLTPGLATGIDFDTLGVREPAADAGNAIGQVLSRAYLSTGQFDLGAHAARAFWARYRRDGRATWPRVTVYAALSFIKNLHFMLCPMRSGRVELLGLWLPVIAEWLEGPDPTILARLSAPAA